MKPRVRIHLAHAQMQTEFRVRRFRSASAAPTTDLTFREHDRFRSWAASLATRRLVPFCFRIFDLLPYPNVGELVKQCYSGQYTPP
jgi:hypothetical protein